MNSISIPEFLSLKNSDENIVVIDIRSSEDFINGFIPESLHIPLNRLAKYLEFVTTDSDKLIISSYNSITSEEAEVLNGIQNRTIVAYLQDGYNGWEKNDEEIDVIIDIDIDELILDIKFDENLLLVDVRSEEDYNNGHAEGAYNLPVKGLNDIVLLADIDTDRNIYIHCGGGSSSILAASYFKKQGIHNCYVVLCGYKCIKDSGQIVLTENIQTTDDSDAEEQAPGE